MAQRPGEVNPPTNGGVPMVLTWAKFQEICVTIALTGAKYNSCEAHGVKYNTVLQAMNEQQRLGDDEWTELWRQSYDEYRENLEAEARRRAVDGWDEPVFHMGKVVGTIHKKSDPLLQSLMIRHGVAGGSPMHSSVADGEAVQGGMELFDQLSINTQKAIRALIKQDIEQQRQERALLIDARVVDRPED